MDSSFKRVAGPSQAFQQSSMYSKRSGDRGPPPLSSSWEDEGSSRKRRYGGERSRDRRDDHRSGERSRDRRDDYGGGGGDRGYLMPPNGFDSRPPPAPAPPPYGSRGSRGEGSNESRRREWDGHRYGGGGGRGGARDRSGGGYHGGDYHHQGVRSRERDAEGDGRRRRGKNYHRYTSRDWGYDRRQRYSRSRSRNDRRGAGGGGGYRETPPPYRGGRGGGEPPAYPPSHRRDPYYPPDGGSGGYHGGGGGGGAFNGAGGRGGYHYDNGNRSRSPHRASSPYHASRSRSFDDRGRGRENHYHREYKGGGGKEKVRIKKEKKPTASMSGGDSNDSRDDTIGHYRGRPGDLIDKRYKVIQDVGMGTFGRVVECYDQKDRFNVAIKVVRDVRKYAESARIEADILRDVNSQKGRGLSHCVQMFRDFFFDGHCCLVFENLGTSLYEFLKAHDFVPYPLGHVREFARQLLEALEFLHGMKLIHTDLKPENILLANNETVKQGKAVAPASTLVKVIDFGGATYDDDDHKSTIVNTRQYRAPEVILEVGWSYPSDLWSAGCIIAELYTGDLLFATHNNMEHLALMERCLSPFPREMLERSKIAPKFFDMSKLICSWRDELDKESKKHVRSMQRLEATRPDDNEMEEAIPDTAISEDDLQLQVKEQAASNLSFADLCARMEKVTREVRQRDLKLDVLFPKKLRLALKGSSPYPLFRLLLPQIDTARGAYYIKQAGLARLYLQVLALDLKNSADAQKLLRYRQPPPPRTLHGPKKRAVTYDWPEVLEEVLIGRVPKDPSKLNLGRINELLDRLARAEDNTQRIAVLSDVTRLLSPNENKWLARIILQDMKIGMREEQILGFYHSQAMDLWAVTCDLRYVCSELSENARQIDRQSTNIQLFRPFTPMLAAMIHHQLHKVEPAMRLHPFAIEMKIDGERMLCHKKGSDVRWWTRSATNYTKMYGPLLSDSIIKNVGLENCILDGEVIGWDVEHECFLPFKENRSIAVEELRSPGSSAENPRKLVYVIFDIVFLQGPNAQDLLDKHASMVTSEERRQGSVTHLPLRARRDILQEIVAQEKKKLELMRHQRVESEVPEERSETLMKAFDAALEHREEGLVVKDLTSPYILGEKGRSLMLWIKMKPEYSDQTKNLDVIVLGAYYSEGKRRHGGQLGSLLIGVAESLEEIALKQEAIKKEEEGISNGDSFPIIPWADEERPPRIPRSAVKSAEEKARETQWFYTLGRVGNGLSFQEWEDLEKCLTLKKWPAAGRALAKHFKPWKIQKRDVPDFCIEPQKSVIVEVKCAEIVKSDAFSSGLTLRFPRIEAVRDDKPWYQCITIRELKDLYDDPTRRSAREMRLSQETTSLGVGSSKRRRKATQESGEFPGLIRRAPVQVVATYKTVDPSSIETKKDVLHGLEICVLGDLELGTLSDSDSGGGGSSESDTGSILSFTSGSSRGDHRYLSKGELEKLIVEAGGTLTSTPRAGRTALVIAPDDRSLRVKMLIKSGNFEIVGIPYILRCLQKGIVADPTFYDFIYMTEATKKKMVRQIDAYGDSYTEPITEVGFKKLARKIQERSKRSWREEGLGTKEVQAILMKSSSNLFWVKCRVCIYFDRYEDVGHLHSASGKLPFSAHRSSAQLPVSRLDFFSCLVRLLGGCVAEALTSEVTHVVVDPQDRQRFKQIAKRLRELRRLPIAQVEKRVVGLEWIEACLEANGIVIVSSQHEIRLPSR